MPETEERADRDLGTHTIVARLERPPTKTMGDYDRDNPSHRHIVLEAFSSRGLHPPFCFPPVRPRGKLTADSTAGLPGSS